MIDIHCHLEYMEKPEEIISEARDKMKAVITSVADPEDMDKIMKLRDENTGFVFVSLGLHPERIEKYTEKQMDEYIEKIRQNKDKIVGVGEIGLDYNWIKDEEKQEHSKKIFEKFIDLALEIKKPVVIHARNGEKNAMSEIIDILEKKNIKNVVMHCFSGSKGELKRCLENGYIISFNTIICKSEKYKKLIKETPVESMVLETDAPWQDPESRELVNRPWKIEQSAQVIAEIKDLPVEHVLVNTAQNAKTFFGLDI